METKDEEDFYYESSPEFWRMIRERRSLPTIPLSEVEKELFADEKPRRRRAATRNGKKKAAARALSGRK
jgi:hypothetical protein